ncbi:antitoxin VbhA family protein [Actinomyces trachealis]|uniref:antitoxin VbhA family protein n=1 Tax=Actinomyces trachealis TaxID=2763540 RepID=UPI0018C675BC|nr:antitoxin VbhA family protein [Actinomyces trachealis]
MARTATIARVAEADVRKRVALRRSRPGSKAERELRVAEAIYSVEMEGLPVSVASRQDAREYVVGRIDSDELVAPCARTLWPRLSSSPRISIPKRAC